MSEPSLVPSKSPSLNLPWKTTPRRGPLHTLQLNLGRFCNLACTHCHVEASPKRTEIMNAEVRNKIIPWILQHRPAVLDLTGGAPELIDGFRELVQVGRQIGAEVLDRCNLAVLDEPGQEDLAQFLADNRVHVIASLPCYLSENVDRQRGRGTYDRSIAGLRKLNALGYGRDLPLHLIYNPGGPSLAPPTAPLEADYRKRLSADWGIEFTGLWCLNNVAITRFRQHLERKNQLESYENMLLQNYNPATLEGLMCRNTLSVDHEGFVYDCDFNLALDLPLADDRKHTLWEIEPSQWIDRPIAMRQHCLACTAGCGSSCTGAIAG